MAWRFAKRVPTLPAMAKPDPSSDTTPNSAEWDRDPIVCVSARERDISFPAALLVRAPTDADVAKWNGDSLTAARNDQRFRLAAGVNFLGTFTTQWRLRDIPSQNAAPKLAPSPDHCAVIWPSSGADGTINAAPVFKFPGTMTLNPAAIHAGWMRVLDYLRAQEARHAADTGQAPLVLFAPASGHEAPQVIVCRLSEVLTQRTEAGQQAHPHMTNAIKWAKNGAHLGALHDYAVRNPSGWNIAEACRQRAAHAPKLAQ